MVEEGSQAPDFELMSDTGETVKLSQFRGRPVVLYFYPRDDTPGCTKEACAFRYSYDEYLARDAVILGVSRDGEESHQKFKQKYDLPFTLLSDPDHEVAEAYGVWAEKSMYGRKSMGIVRSTFVIDANGTVARAMRGIKVPGHSDKVLEALAA
ncbi:MAG: thioredoxin-dependent peroxiredoxin [Gaiellaceae bacterium]|nr:thioredoxin-dependent peroxiredoxin [Gaiellaceae bacterium]